MSNGAYGFTIQKLICDKYGLEACENADKQFKAQYEKKYKNNAENKIRRIFEKINDRPVKCVTYMKDENNKPYGYNFILESGKTLSIKSNTSQNSMVTVNKIGQAGYEVLNEYFAEIYGKEIKSQRDIKRLFLKHIGELIQIYLNEAFSADYVVYVKKSNKSVTLINAQEIDFINFENEKFEFTKNQLNESGNGKKWNVSTTVKYDGEKIAEIEVGAGNKRRLLIFRFCVDKIPDFIKKVKENNETLGISAEAAVCKLFNIEQPKSFQNRVVVAYVDKLMPVLERAFKKIPPAIKHSGSLPGERGERSKCSYDFVLEGNLTLSLKTNKGNKVCPPEVGQPGSKTCLRYFGEFFDKEIKEVTRIEFKKMVFENIDKIMPIYVNHLFDSDWLLWIYKTRNDFDYKSIKGNDIDDFKWEKEKFSFTKKTVDEWIGSNSVKYDGLTIGEFQLHQNRNCFKFRFNMKNILKLLKNK